MISFYKDFLEFIALISPPAVIIDRYSIAARILKSASGNLFYLFIEFLFESEAGIHTV